MNERAKSPHHRFPRACEVRGSPWIRALVLLVIGAATALEPSPARAHTGVAEQDEAGPTPGAKHAVEWVHEDFGQVLDRAVAANHRVMLYVFAPGSAHCVRTYQQALADAGVREQLAGWICTAANAAEVPGAELVSRYRVRLLPSILFLEANGQVEDAVLGAIDGPSLAQEIRRITARQATISALRKIAESRPDDLQALLDLATKQRHVGDVAGYEQTVTIVRRLDPRGRTEVGSRLLLREHIATAEDAAFESAERRLDLEPVRKFLRSCSHPAVRFEGWEWIAESERGLGNGALAREAQARAWEDVAPNAAMDWGADVLAMFLEEADELDTGDRRFAGEVAKRVERDTEAALAQASASGDHSRNEAYAAKLAAAAAGHFLRGNRKHAQDLLQRALRMAPEHEDVQRIARGIEAKSRDFGGN